MTATALLIRNPASRHAWSAAMLEGALAVAREATWDITVVVTERDRHATEIARDAASRGVHVVIANGGDGTINEAINGLAGTSTALGVLPAGTANVWAKEVGIPKQPEQSMRAIVEGERRLVDLGCADGRYFLLMAGVGFDAEIVPRVGPRMKRWLGAAAYIVAGAPRVVRATAPTVWMKIDGVASQAPLYWLVAGNTRSYGGLFDIAHRAAIDDGLLDVVIMHRGGVRRIVADGVRLLRKRHEESPNVDYIRARTIEIETPGIAVQLDGEYYARTPMRVEIAPAALTVIVPPGTSTPLLSSSPAPRTTAHEKGSW